MYLYPNVESFLEKKDLTVGKVGIFFNKTLFPFQYSFKGAGKLVIFLPGAFNRKNPMPKFQRAGYFEDLKYNCISFFDPSLFLTGDSSFNRGWFIGTKEQSYIDGLYVIISNLLSKYKIDYKDVLFYSTSAGGIPSIKLACKFPDCHVYCGNIQTNLFNHYPDFIRKLSLVCFEEDLDVIRLKYADRMSIWNDDANFYLHISQNKADSFHFKNHFKPYVDTLKDFKKVKFEVAMFKDSDSGHNPLAKDIELSVINSILDNKSFKEIFDGFDAEYLSNY